jgi:energy-coupling factor transporter ATP-binding protein EcfA2
MSGSQETAICSSCEKRLPREFEFTRGSNPFSSCFVRPGAIRYRFDLSDLAQSNCEDADEVALLELERRFELGGRMGEIVGPHGSGKSTLLAALLQRWKSEKRSVRSFVLHDRAGRLPVRLGHIDEPRPVDTVVVDGVEQLTLWHRWRLIRFCRRSRKSLLVTSHRSVGLPLLLLATTDSRLVGRLVKDLLDCHLGRPNPDWVGAVFTSEKIEAVYRANRENVRETFFELYDLYEKNRK